MARSLRSWEAWLGEHHSAGTEICSSRDIFIAVAVERTKHIKLGAGVLGLSYHNPLWVAERMVMLDHLTCGRVMLAGALLRRARAYRQTAEANGLGFVIQPELRPSIPTEQSPPWFQRQVRNRG